MNMKFEKLINSFKAEKLFKEKLLPDIKKGNVFLAVRKDASIDMYHKGSKLFSYDCKDGFKTHVKFASVLHREIDDTEDYVSEKIFKDPSKRSKLLIKNFAVEYERIKENCRNYAGVEAEEVSKIYKKFSYLSKFSIVVLDLEVAFATLPGEKGKQDRIDILLYDKKSCELKFIEAKHFTNKELWSKKGVLPKVLKIQIPKYNAQIKARGSEIIVKYTEVIEILNNLFDDEKLDLPNPKKVFPKTTLLCFGFDANQRDGRLQELLINDGSLGDFPYYFRGNIGSNKFTISSLWNGQRKK